MLEFLGLEEEALQVLWGCILIGIALGIQIGALAGYGNNTKEAKASVGQIIFLILCIILGAVGFLMGILPAIVLFFTFQWKYLIGAIFAGIIAVLPTYFLSRAAVLRRRRSKYMHNPIVLEAVEFCRQHNVVGIQCFPDGMRFFTKLAHPGYCKKEIHLEVTDSAQKATEYKNNWKLPAAWAAYSHCASCIGVIKFSDRGYPNVPDLPMFAGALAKKLEDFAYAEHDHRVQYDTVTFSVNTKTTTHNITILHEDCFVYSRKAYRQVLQEWKHQERSVESKPEKPAPKEKTNTWE